MGTLQPLDFRLDTGFLYLFDRPIKTEKRPLQKIIRALKANGSPMPIFETDKDRTYFMTTFLIHPEFITSDEGRNEGRNSEETVVLTGNEQLILKHHPPG